MEGNQCRRRIARQRKHELLFASRIRDARKRGGFSWLDCDAAKMDCAIKVPFYDRFQEIPGAHRGAARGEEDVRLVQAFLDGGDMRFNAVCRK